MEKAQLLLQENVFGMIFINNVEMNHVQITILKQKGNVNLY